MADIKQTLLASAFLCLLSGTVFAGVNVTSLEAGYKAYPSATKQKNKGAWDQSVFKLIHLGIVDWGSYFVQIKLENPGQLSKNQLGQDGVTTIKVLNIVEYALTKSAFNIWGQNIITANENLVEDNLYFGGSHNVKLAGAAINYGIGFNYTYASFSPTNQDFSGMSGYAAVFNLRYPFAAMGVKNTLLIYYEGQFDRAPQHKKVFAYRDYGHQLITTLKTNITDTIYTKLHVTQFDSWAATPKGGIEYGVAVGINF